MSFSDPAPSFVQPALFPNGLEAMEFWPQFPNEQHESNGQFDHCPPFKRPKNSDDSLPIIHNQRIPSTNPPVNHPTIGRMFFKTRLCAKFRMGKCPNGENCNFAHGDEDLRKPPPNWQELMAGRAENRGNGTGNWEDDDRIIHKMKLCKKFYNGEECPYGDRCNFLHKEPPKFKDNIVNNNNNNAARFREYSRESSAISIGTTGPPMVQGGLPDQYDMNRMGNGGMDASRGNSRPVYWKTRLCNRFEDTGHCAFGDKCHYAHGRTELLLPGGRPADSEPVATNNAPVKSTPTPSNEPAPVKVEMGDPSNQEGPVKKWFLKWKPNKKINRIYGDWIDDLDIILPDEVDS